ncbi:hypothetical protein MMM136_14740 [Helicobacter pylori]
METPYFKYKNDPEQLPIINPIKLIWRLLAMNGDKSSFWSLMLIIRVASMVPESRAFDNP